MTMTGYERYHRVPELLALRKPAKPRTPVDEPLFPIEERWVIGPNDGASHASAALDQDDLALARNGLFEDFTPGELKP